MSRSSKLPASRPPRVRAVQPPQTVPDQHRRRRSQALRLVLGLDQWPTGLRLLEQHDA